MPAVCRSPVWNRDLLILPEDEACAKWPRIKVTWIRATHSPQRVESLRPSAGALECAALRLPVGHAQRSSQHALRHANNPSCVATAAVVRPAPHVGSCGLAGLAGWLIALVTSSAAESDSRLFAGGAQHHSPHRRAHDLRRRSAMAPLRRRRARSGRGDLHGAGDCLPACDSFGQPVLPRP